MSPSRPMIAVADGGREQVRGQHPGDPVLGRVQVVLDRGQRGDHRRAEHREREARERRAPPASHSDGCALPLDSPALAARITMRSVPVLRHVRLRRGRLRHLAHQASSAVGAPPGRHRGSSARASLISNLARDECDRRGAISARATAADQGDPARPPRHDGRVLALGRRRPVAQGGPAPRHASPPTSRWPS